MASGKKGKLPQYLVISCGYKDAHNLRLSRQLVWAIVRKLTYLNV